jgi:hypothetical protein
VFDEPCNSSVDHGRNSRVYGHLDAEYKDDPKLNWYKGVTVTFALQDVHRYYVFTEKDLDAYMKSFKKEE